MENVIILIFDLFLFIFYTFVGFLIFLLIQLISYRVFKFNLYKWLMYNLIEKELKKLYGEEPKPQRGEVEQEQLVLLNIKKEILGGYKMEGVKSLYNKREEIIKNKLIELGFNISSIGFDYWIYAIELKQDVIKKEGYKMSYVYNHKKI